MTTFLRSILACSLLGFVFCLSGCGEKPAETPAETPAPPAEAPAEPAK